MNANSAEANRRVEENWVVMECWEKGEGSEGVTSGGGVWISEERWPKIAMAPGPLLIFEPRLADDEPIPTHHTTKTFLPATVEQESSPGVQA